jgi:hypothetical protein
MTNEELDEARAKEANLIWGKQNCENPRPSIIAARLAREGWTPPEPVDPDVLAFREWEASAFGPADIYRAEVIAGKHDRGAAALTYLAGARMGREQERERARVLVDHAELTFNNSRNFSAHAWKALAKYRGEA